MTDSERFEEWFSTAYAYKTGLPSYKTVKTTKRDAYLAALQSEREEIAKMLEKIDCIAGPLLAAEIRAQGEEK